jgi:hypothetical protein
LIHARQNGKRLGRTSGRVQTGGYQNARQSR